MDDSTRVALEAIRLDWAVTPDDVWEPQAALHVPGLHTEVLDDVMRAFGDAERSTASSPLGVAIRGPAGAGKTHLLGQVRERVQEAGGYFFLIKLLDGEDFWRSVLVALLGDLGRPSPTHRSQLAQLLDRLGRNNGVDADVLASVTGDAPLTREALESYVVAVYRKVPRHIRRKSQHVLRALVLTESDDFAQQDIGESSLLLDLDDAADGAAWGIQNTSLAPQEIVENISRVIAMDSAAVVAVDQIDTIVATSVEATAGAGDDGAINRVAHGLMSLRETMSRTTSVVSCLGSAWDMLERHAPQSVIDRYRKPRLLQRTADPTFARALLTKRFAPCFERVGFVPPYPTWPVTEEAFTTTRDFTPRDIMRTVDRHVGGALRDGSLAEFTDFRESVSAKSVARPSNSDPLKIDQLGELDRRLAALITASDPSPAFDPKSEDVVVPALLADGLAMWVEARADSEAFASDGKPGKNPPLHARLRRTVDEATDSEQSWAFRAIAATHHSAVLTRLGNAGTAAGMGAASPLRTLFLLRRDQWPGGPKTTQTLNQLRANGARFVSWTADDVKVLMALSTMRSERSEFLPEWLASRNPAQQIGFLAELSTLAGDAVVSGEPTSSVDEPAVQPTTLAPPAIRPSPVRPSVSPGMAADVLGGGLSSSAADQLFKETTAPSSPSVTPSVRPSITPHVDSPAPQPNSIVLGRTVGAAGRNGQPVQVALEALRKHTVIFAGSGSGKTVLIRHLVEQAALAGVSSIVLDVNNDLSRLGVGWPDGTRTFTDAERRQARDYLRTTEVAVYTPGRMSGRPLAFAALPDFAAVRGDRDEFAHAVDAAVGGLSPRLNLGATPRARKQRAVLKEAMTAFGRAGGGSLDAFAGYLAELPEETSSLADGPRLAASLAEDLRAAMVLDFSDGGEAADPGTLLTPSPGYRARVSVINLAGLGSVEKRDNFVNELEMALFAWIKRHPAGDRPLGGLLVMDEAQNFVPSARTTACSTSTLALASQARKYGLGLIFATQAPKGLRPEVPGNAATQFFGLLNAPVQIDAAQELAARKGSRVADIGRLPTGTFYAAVEGGSFTKVSTPLCLTYHPKSPPTEDEVAEIARSGNTE